MVKELTTIIPCYNEEKNLPQILEICSKEASERFRFCLVNNGSTDGTLDILNKFDNKFIKVINLDNNQGYGGGILNGLNSVETEFSSWTHADLLKTLKFHKKIFIENSDYFVKENIIKGTRKNRNSFDTFFTNCMSLIVLLFTRFFIKDINAQPKIFHTSIKDQFLCPPKDFNLDLYLLVVSRKKKYNIISIDVEKDDRTLGKAKGGGSFIGKIKLSISTFLFLSKSNFK